MVFCNHLRAQVTPTSNRPQSANGNPKYVGFFAHHLVVFAHSVAVGQIRANSQKLNGIDDTDFPRHRVINGMGSQEYGLLMKGPERE